MNESDAFETLSSLGYLPGVSSTSGMAPKARERVKAAIRRLKSAGELAEAIEALTNPKPKPRKPAPKAPKPKLEDADNG